MSFIPVELRPHLRRQGLEIVAAMALLSLSALLELVPHLVVYLTALGALSGDLDPSWLWTLAAVALAGVFVRFVLLGSGYVLSHAVGFAMVHDLRLEMVRKLSNAPASFLNARSQGELKKALIEDAASLEHVFAHTLPELSSGLFVPLVALSCLVWVDLRLALASVLLMPVAFALQGALMGGMSEQFEQWHAAEARANEGVLEFIRGVAVLKAFDRDASSLGHVREGIFGIRDLAISMTRRSMAGFGIFMSLISGNLMVVLPTGLALFLWGQIDEATLVLFVALGTGMLTPLLKVIFMMGSVQKTLISLRRVLDVLQAPEPPVGLSWQTDGHQAVGPAVDFDAVTFSYPGVSRPAVDGVTLRLEPGTVTAVVGPSGAGKSTLARLLARQWDPDEGSVSISGRDVRELSEAERLESVSHVPQTPVLFDATVHENLALARPGATREQVAACARATHAHEFVERLPQGYDTPLGDRGASLSGGERQRLTIARALLKGSPVVILDEVTANVDPESERGIQEGLRELARGRTMLVVAHRLRTIANVDQIAVMDAGRLVGAGSHEELLEDCPTYETLWREQELAGQWTMGGAR